jgi:demethylmenaquinone methyltransferase/2-methoxy-6-polyprenyl-1,4-benzoquinol methylase
MIVQDRPPAERNADEYHDRHIPGDKGKKGQDNNATPSGRDTFVREIFAAIASDIDFLSSFFSFGLDQMWRKKLVRVLALKGGEKVLDICTGTGKLALLISRRLGKRGSVFGVDFSKEMLEVAAKKPGASGRNIRFGLSDAKDLRFPPDSFDAVTVGFGMRNIADTAAALREACRVLRPGGKFCCLELTPPTAPAIKPLYMVYCFKIMPFIAMKVLKTDVPYNYLPRSIKAFSSPDEFRQMLATCGFADITVYSMTFGIATIYEARKS